MLAQFSWQQFLIAALILTAIWYAAVIPIFYRKRVSLSLKKGSRIRSTFDPCENEDANDFSESDADDLIGKSALPEGVSELQMDLISFAPEPESRSSNTEEDRDTRLGLIPDVPEELKTIFSVIEKEGGNKEDFLSLSILIRSKYPRIKGTANEAALNQYIRESSRLITITTVKPT